MFQIILSILIFCHLFFWIAWKTDRFSVMDIAWGLGFILIGIVGYMQNFPTPPKAVLLFMVTVWGLRLAWHIFKRFKDAPEDPRYAKLRQQWGSDYLKQGYLKIFMAQGAAMFVVSLPLQLGMSSELEHFGFKQVIGLLVWLAGFSFEAWADWHLAKFKANPANHGKLCTDGPWQYVRYPNYLGEMTLWWGVYIFIFNFWTAWTFVGPLALCYSILKVTGIPLQEEKKVENPAYRDYAAKVPLIIPKLPKALAK